MTNRIEVEVSEDLAEVWTPEAGVKVLTYYTEDGAPYTVVDVSADPNTVVIVNDWDVFRDGDFA